MISFNSVLQWFVAAIKVPLITDWIMVVITIAYVLATIAIYRSNKGTLEAAKKQVDASISQAGILKDQIKISTNLQLFESRVKTLKQLEDKTGFLEHESLLDILFTEEIVNLEKQVILLCNQRNLLLLSFSSISRQLNYLTFFNENFPKLKNAYISKLDIGFFIDSIEIKASAFTSGGEPILDPEKSESIREQAFAITDEIELKRADFFSFAKMFIKSTIEQETDEKPNFR